MFLVEAGGEKLALKKVLAQLPEQAEAARWEIKVHSTIKHPNVMPLIDHCVVPAANGAEEFRLLMPLYPHGTLLDRGVRLMQQGERMPERECLKIFSALLSAVAVFHEHDPPWSRAQPGIERSPTHVLPSLLPAAVLNALSILSADRDIKPANVLLGEDDVPVLMDFGSVKEARISITSRTEALLLQEDAAQNCSMPYRAPELFDVPSDAQIDERTDVFSLGATLYAMAYYYSPFECTFQGDTQHVVECSHLRVIGGPQFPSKCDYSDAFIDLIQAMLAVDPKRRPTVHQVLARVQQLLSKMA